MLALQYIGVFALIALSWPLELAVVKLVTGWISGAILGLALLNIRNTDLDHEEMIISGIVFRVLAVVLAFLVAYSLAIRLVIWLPEIKFEQAFGGLALIAVGLLHLGLTAIPFRVIIGLLTVLSGFEVLYAAIEQSTLVTGLLAFVTLGLALIGAYLLLAPTLEETE
jgi:hypothetical protein